jgi:hypothetical protein
LKACNRQTGTDPLNDIATLLKSLMQKPLASLLLNVLRNARTIYISSALGSERCDLRQLVHPFA